MAKLTLTDLTNLSNEASVVATINANNALIEAALENTLSRDGTTPNTMSADHDMNSNKILNLPLPTTDTEPLRLGDISNLSGVRGALVNTSADQLIVGSSFQSVAWDTETYDTSGIHDTVTNNERLVVPAGVSKVRITMNLEVQSSSSTGYFVAQVTKNGVNSFPGAPLTYMDFNNVIPLFVHIESAIIEVEPGDYFLVRVAETSIANDVQLKSGDHTWACMEIIG